MCPKMNGEAAGTLPLPLLAFDFDFSWLLLSLDRQYTSRQFAGNAIPHVTVRLRGHRLVFVTSALCAWLSRLLMHTSLLHQQSGYFSNDTHSQLS